MIKQCVLSEEEYDELIACKQMLERLEAPLEALQAQSYGGATDFEPTIFWRGMEVKLTLLPQNGGEFNVGEAMQKSINQRRLDTIFQKKGTND